MRPLRGLAVGARRPPRDDEEAGAWHGPDQLLLRPEEAARALGIGRSKLFELLAIGDLPVVRIGRATRVPASALRRWVEERTVAAADSSAVGEAPASGRRRGRDEQRGPIPSRPRRG